MNAPVVAPSGLRVALAWLPAAAYTGLIWWLSSQALPIPQIALFPLQDKGAHMLEYTGLGLCLCHAVYTTWPGRGLRAAIVAVFMTTALGLSDELHQAFVPARSADVLDLGADFLGAVLAALIYVAVQRLRRRRAQKPTLLAS
jgi:VanZ family protein